MLADPTPDHSNAQLTDTDWDQIRETMLMLNLAVAKIESDLVDGDNSVVTVASSLTAMMKSIQTIRTSPNTLHKNQEQLTISDNCNIISEQIHDAIVAFQFVDRLTQCVSHLSVSMGALTNLLDQPELRTNFHAWSGLKEMIKATYTVESDIKMFEAIELGKSVEEALNQYEQAKNDKSQSNNDDIEFF